MGRVLVTGPPALTIEQDLPCDALKSEISSSLVRVHPPCSVAAELQRAWNAWA